MAVYGIQADVEQNKGRNVILYTPGKTQLTPQDVFLGGTATGVSDAQLNGATRVYGNTAVDTANALSEYNNDISSQIRAAIAQNAAPRADASRGTPSLARQAQEIEQAQSKISNDMNAAQLTGSYNNAPTLAQKTFEHGVGQDAFTNEYNVGNMMGNYKGSPTLSKQAQSIQDAQFNAGLNQDESQFGRTLSSGNYNSAADRALSVQKSSMPSATQVKANYTATAYADIQSALDQGTSPDAVKQNILSHSGDYASIGINPSTLISQVDAIVKSWGEVTINPNVTNSNASAAWNSLNNMWKK